MKELDNSTYEYFYGGIPQLVNLIDFNETIQNSIQYNNISHLYDNLLVFDFEEWSPIWDTLESQYKKASIQYIQNLFPMVFPDKNDPILYIFAMLSWESSSMELMLSAIETCRELVPNALIGYYGYPNMPYWGDAKDFKTSRKNNDKLALLWKHVDILLPSIYQFYNSTGDIGVFQKNKDYVRRKILESIRIQKKQETDKLIYPYTWHRYHDPPNDLLKFNEFLLEYSYVYSFEDVNGVVLWSSETTEDLKNETIWWFAEYSNMFEQLDIKKNTGDSKPGTATIVVASIALLTQNQQDRINL